MNKNTSIVTVRAWIEAIEEQITSYRSILPSAPLDDKKQILEKMKEVAAVDFREMPSGYAPKNDTDDYRRRYTEECRSASKEYLNWSEQRAIFVPKVTALVAILRRLLRGHWSHYIPDCYPLDVVSDSCVCEIQDEIKREIKRVCA